MNKKILIVGIDGVIGSSLYQHFKKNSCYDVFGTTRRKENLNADLQCFYLDLADLAFNLSFQQFDLVYLCAGVSNMKYCQENPDLSAQINVEGIKNIIDFYYSVNTKFVFLSTSQVFSGTHKPISSDDAPHPKNRYGLQKLMIEQYLASKTHHYSIVRLSKVLNSELSLIKDWRNKLESGDHIEAFYDVNIAPISLDYAVQLLERIGIDSESGIYQLSGMQDISYYDFAKKYAQYLGAKTSQVIPISHQDKKIENIYISQFTTMNLSKIMDKHWPMPASYDDLMQILI